MNIWSGRWFLAFSGMLAAWTAGGAFATTINVSGCSESAVQAAINSAKDGDIVMIPAGSCTWTQGVNWTDKNVWVIGAGIGSTVISVNGNGAFSATASSSAKASYRISGLTITGNPGGISGIISLSSMSSGIEVYGFRVDHVKFSFSTTDGTIAIFVTGILHGLIDHCQFIGGSFLGISVYGHTDHEYNLTPGHIEGLDAWTIPTNLGTREAVYVEDSTFAMNGGYSSAVNDQWMGARFVFRHNTVTDGFIQTHSTRANARGAVKYEIYNNTWTGIHFYRWGQIRSGTGVIFNNTVTGYLWNHVDLDDQRADTETGCSVNYPPLGACTGGNPNDGNVESSGWPCLDQIGRGAGTAVGSQPSIPLYGWKNGSNPTCATGGACDNSSTIVINSACLSVSKYIKSTPHSNGQVDFVNNADTPKAGYAPYIYPHPLQSQVTPPPSQLPPSNLRIS